VEEEAMSWDRIVGGFGYTLTLSAGAPVVVPLTADMKAAGVVVFMVPANQRIMALFRKAAAVNVPVAPVPGAPGIPGTPVMNGLTEGKRYRLAVASDSLVIDAVAGAFNMDIYFCTEVHHAKMQNRG